MKRVLAAALTVILMGFVAWVGARRAPVLPDAERRAEPAANPAEARIRALLESAWNGDVAAYLASFAAPLRGRLEREVDERGRPAFAADLQRAARARKSHAVFAAETEGPDTARVTVETVYADRNERQTYRLDRGPEGWLVTEVATARGHLPKAKFGAPAQYQEPEGVPVQSEGLAVETGEPDMNP